MGSQAHPDAPIFSDVRLAVVGAGRLGTSLALAVRDRGGRVVAFTCRTPQGSRRAEGYLGMPASFSLAELLSAKPNLVVMAVPDGSLPGVARQLARESAGRGSRETGTHHTRATVVHTSGATPVTVLAPLAHLGHPTLAIHPLQTFAEPLSGAGKLAGSAFAVTPGPHTSYQEGARLAEGLGGRPFHLAERDRPLYHAAAVLASNYLVTIAWLAEQLVQSAGIDQEDALCSLLPLIRGALDNLAERGSVEALTGPLSRGDESTVARHLQALEATHPDLLPVYRALGASTLELVKRRGVMPPDLLTRLLTLLQSNPPAVSGHSLRGSATSEPFEEA